MSMDCAGTAVQLSAEDSYIVYRRYRKELPVFLLFPLAAGGSRLLHPIHGRGVFQRSKITSNLIGCMRYMLAGGGKECKIEKGVENYIKKVYIDRVGGMMQTNVTVKAEDTLIERAKEFDDFMDRVKYANPGRTFSREEMNAR
ncbi:MAG: hypothetical protein PVH61_29705 [Candidatus Aminicenantes bacterium]